jgi:predicted nucleic acid-binding protein
MNSLVVDASVAVKWMIPSPRERLVPESIALHERFVRNEIEIAVPDLFWPEIGNVLWKSIRTGLISEKDATVALSSLGSESLLTVPSVPLISEALKIAVQYQRTVYDCMYVALAQQTRCALITADEKLVNALARDLPVRWLGALA